MKLVYQLTWTPLLQEACKLLPSFHQLLFFFTVIFPLLPLLPLLLLPRATPAAVSTTPAIPTPAAAAVLLL
jgi:hypothetical protein